MTARSCTGSPPNTWQKCAPSAPTITPLILKANMDPAGHGGASGRYDRLHEAAFDYAYFLTQMGINN